MLQFRNLHGRTQRQQNSPVWTLHESAAKNTTVGVEGKKTDNVSYRLCVNIVRISLHILQKYFDKYSKFLTHTSTHIVKLKH